MEQIDYNLLFRWFVGFSMDDEVWDHSTFTKNRDRLLSGDVARQFFAQVLGQAERADLLSKEHFSVDGTMIEALASLKSCRPKDEDEPPEGGGRNCWVDFRGEKRSRDTHESKTDKEALLYKKSQGTEAKLSFLGHVLMENRHGLVVDAQVTQATGTAEREAAVDMAAALSGTHRVTRTLTTISATAWTICGVRMSRRMLRRTPASRPLVGFGQRAPQQVVDQKSLLIACSKNFLGFSRKHEMECSESAKVLLLPFLGDS